ncbi:Complement component 1 Q subcomponent-binding protein, mitochondrial [Ancistrocladus abbreviatus]
MDSWLKRAEASNGQTAKAKRTKSKAKAQKRVSADESLKAIQVAQEEASTRTPELDSKADEATASLSFENDGMTPGPTATQSSDKHEENVDNDVSITVTSSAEASSNDVEKHDGERAEAAAAVVDKEAVTSSSNGEISIVNAPSIHEEILSSASNASGTKPVNSDHPVDPERSIALKEADSSLKPDQVGSQPVTTDMFVSPGNNDEKQLKHADATNEPVSSQKEDDHKAMILPNKVQEQLDEAQGLLKSTNSTGQSKEARLARVCAGLSSRLQEYKYENAQLEELLTAERELSKSYEGSIKQLQKELSASKAEMNRVETNMGEALAAKNSEIEALVNSVELLKKQAAFSEGNLASLQVNMETLMRNRELTETRMMQALREELASAERRAEEERSAHNATKKAAMGREVELEHQAVEASTALARIQRVADERMAKAAELEQKLALLEVECASLNQELQDMEARIRRGQKKSPEDANQLIQIQAWQEEVERARQGQRDAETKISSLEAEVQKMRVEMAAMKRDADHYSRQEHMELEKRYRELTDLLYYKQTQLETMASEKAAAEFQLEKEIKRLQEAQAEAEKSRVSRRASTTWEEDTDIKELEPLPLFHRHMVGASMQLRKAAKLLDSGAVRATRFLWRYPRARVCLLFYLVFVHLFLMYLLHRLQVQDYNFAAREFAQSMGLSQPNLP